MNISYYREWVNNFPFTCLVFKDLIIYEETIELSFKESIYRIYIHLSPNCLIFYHSEQLIPEGKQMFGLYPQHLAHSVFNGCKLLANDKIIAMHFRKWNIYNEVENYYLVWELIPRYQNIILYQEIEERKVIIDCWKKISYAENHIRQILPGAEYSLPQTSYIHQEEKITFPLIVAGRLVESLNEFFLNFYIHQELVEKTNKLKNQLLMHFQKKITKYTTKLAKQEIELHSAEEWQYWYYCIELLKINLHLISPGMETITVQNFFKDGFPEEQIQINAKLSPQKNLDYYVKKYRKSLSGQKMIEEKVNTTVQEIQKLQSIVNDVTTIDNYFRLKEFKPEETPNNKQSEKKLFRVIKISADWEILIGRSSKENDLLTCKIAKPDDWWFHTRIFHGTHLVLRNFRKQNIPENLVQICSGLAAFYSKAKTSTNVPVDYTQIKYVRKPRGSIVGYVVYSNQRTIYVDPLDIRNVEKKLK